jgi:integrase
MLIFSSIIDEWLSQSKHRLKPTTYATYETVASRHIRPVLGGLSPEELSEQALFDFWDSKGGEGLSCSTLRSISVVLRSVLKRGERYGFAPLGGMCAAPSQSKRSSVSILSDEEQLQIVSAIGKNPRGRGLGVLVCLYTGLRVGEVCGLKWGDVSPDNRSLTVRRTVSRIHNSGGGKRQTILYVGEPKSRDSCRRIPLPPKLSEAFESARGYDEDYMLTDNPTRISEPRTMQRYFERLLEDAGIEHVKYHALRHSFATRCVDLGFDVKALSMILGHADVAITLNTYVHPSFEKMRSMMEQLDY